MLLTSLSAFADPKEGENNDTTTEHVTQPCDGKVDDQVTASDKQGEGKDAVGTSTETKEE